MQVSEMMARLSLREKIGQTVVLNEPDIRNVGDLTAFFSRYPVGGMFVGSEVIKDAEDSRAGVTARTRELAAANAGLPLVFASDMENGCGSMVEGLTPFPHQMALGATGSEKLAYDYGRYTALESRSVGVQWTFSPVADLNVNRFNPITNIRSVGDDPALAKRLLVNVVKGMQDHGLAACAKHFPGDGMDYRDQHQTTTVNPLSKAEWMQMHGGVFKRLIDEGVYTIMTGHITLPACQTVFKDDRFLPATLSHELSTVLLKQELGFKGVIVSDALTMGGFIKWFERTQSLIECFKAGSDMLLWPDLAYFDAMEKAIESGEVSMVRLDDAVGRVLVMKEKLGLLSAGYPAQLPISAADSNATRGLAREVAEQSLTLVRDRQGFLPVSKFNAGKVLVVAITMDDKAFERFNVLKHALEAHGSSVTIMRSVWYTDLDRVAADFDLILYAIESSPHKPMGPLNFWGREAAGIWSSLACGREKSLVVSFGSPYFCAEYFDAADVFVNAYSSMPATQEAFVRALFGEIGFTGKSPVKLY